LGFLNRLLQEAFRGLLADGLTFALLAVSLTYLIEALRSATSPSPSTPLTLLFEAAVAGAISLLLTHLPWRRERRKDDLGRLDLSKMTIEAGSRLPPPESATERGSGAGSAKVRYGKEFTTTPDYGLKILKPVEGLHKGQPGVKPARRGRPIKGGGYIGGRRSRAVSSSSRGMYASYRIPKGRPRDVALVPTLRAAALRQPEGGGRTPRVVIKPEDIRVKVREYHAPFSIILLVDMSMSMIQSMNNLIQAVYSLHGRVYRRRDRVGLIVFKGSRAFTVQHPTTNLALVVEKLRRVGASDFTPMAAGLLQALKALKQERRRNRDAVPNLIVFSDGIVNVPLDEPLSPLTRRRYMSEAQADSFDVARLMAKEGFRVYVVNTNHSKAEAEAFPAMEEGWRLRLTPTQFLIELARISGGGYRGLSMDGAQEI